MGVTADDASQYIRRVRERAVGFLRGKFEDSTLLAAAGVLVLVVGAVLGVVVMTSGGSARSDQATSTSPPPVFESVSSSSTTLAQIVVHAAGAVRQPGLHRLPAGARVADLIEAAGGVDDMIDIDRVNLAAPVNDGERVYLPRRGESDPETSGPSGQLGNTSPLGSPIDLNTATQQQLDDLPGVGPATAAAIVAERKSRGRYASVDDLLDVRGIGTAKLEQIRGLVVIR
jgi:competence protein ComEA